jgi:hypothetical protein
MTYTKVIIAYMLSWYTYIISLYYMNLPIYCCVACVYVLSYPLISKRQRSCAYRMSSETDVETIFGGKEIKRLKVLEKIDSH